MTYRMGFERIEDIREGPVDSRGQRFAVHEALVNLMLSDGNVRIAESDPPQAGQHVGYHDFLV